MLLLMESLSVAAGLYPARPSQTGDGENAEMLKGLRKECGYVTVFCGTLSGFRFVVCGCNPGVSPRAEDAQPFQGWGGVCWGCVIPRAMPWAGDA